MYFDFNLDYRGYQVRNRNSSPNDGNYIYL